MEFQGYFQAHRSQSLGHSVNGRKAETRSSRQGVARLSRLWGLTISVPLMVANQVSPAIAALTRGSRGPDVINLQNKLRAAGFFKGPVTGFYGSQTEEAVRQFQSSQGLTSDGVVGQQTLAALGGPSISRGQQGYSAKTIELQRLLRQQGFYNGPITGVYSSRTQAAVRSAQRSLGLVEDGIAGPLTLAKLRGTSGPRSGKVGSRPDTVTLQRLLKERGFYQGPITGFYGPLTRAAVRKAQAFYKLPVDGVAGSLTLAALQQSSGGLPPMASSANPSRLSPARVQDLQRLLSSRGYYTGEIDGIYGEQTRTAVLKAQRDLRLTVDGIPGEATFAALQQGRNQYGTVPVSTRSAPTNTKVIPVPAPPPRRSSAAVPDNRQSAVTNPLELQRRLAKAGYYQGALNGVYDATTRLAIKVFQKQQGLVADGIAGSLTISALEQWA